MKRMIIGLTIVLGSCTLMAGNSYAAINYTHLKDEKTSFLCQAIGFTMAGGLDYLTQDESTAHALKLVDEISSRKDYDQKSCEKFFNKGAISAANMNLNKALEQ